MEKIKLTQVEDHPVCPHCDKKLTEIHWHKMSGSIGGSGYVAVYSCSHCKKMLSSSAHLN